jgi:hypothetical protein
LDLNLLALGALACEELSWREGEFGRLQDSEADAPLSFDGVSLDAEWALKVNDLIFENNVYNLRTFENTE